MPRDPGQAHATALQMNEEPDVVGDQPAPSKNLHRKEVDPGQHGQMRLDEFLPPCVLAPFRDWRDAMTLQDVPHTYPQSGRSPCGQNISQ
jgi:hypothetical protein